MRLNRNSRRRKDRRTWLRADALCAAAALLMATLSSSMSAQAQPPLDEPVPPDPWSTTGPEPPPGVDVGGSQPSSATATVIPGVPTYIWQHGCGPTAAGMVIGYWDGQGYSGLVQGDASSQSANSWVDEMIASEGPASNYSDYCLPMDDTGTSPWILSDLSELPIGDEHADECLADYMNTSQSYWDLRYGWSYFSDVGSALEQYAESKFHTVLTTTYFYSATVENLHMGSTLDWDSFRAEIDAGRPLVFLVDTDASGGTDHFVTVVGYDEDVSGRYYGCYNTWDHSGPHWYEFEQMGWGQFWGVYGATSFRIESVEVEMTEQVNLPLVLREQ